MRGEKSVPSRPQFQLVLTAGDPEDREAFLAGLVAKVNATWAGLAAAEVGPLTVGNRWYDGDASGWPKLQSAPLEWLGGGVFFLNLGSSEDLLFSPGMIISDLERSVAALPDDRAEARAMVNQARQIAEDAIARRSHSATPAAPVAVGVMPSPYADRVSVVVNLDVLGNDLHLRHTSVQVTGSDQMAEELTAAIDELLDQNELRSDLLRSLQREKARGMIEETTRRILTAAGMDLEFALDRLGWNNILKFGFDGGRQHATLYWRDGVLAAGFHDPAANVLLSDGTLRFDPIPETLAMGLAGRAVGEVLTQEHIPANAVITNSSVNEHWTVLELDIPSELFRTAGSAIPF